MNFYKVRGTLAPNTANNKDPWKKNFVYGVLASNPAVATQIVLDQIAGSTVHSVVFHGHFDRLLWGINEDSSTRR